MKWTKDSCPVEDEPVYPLQEARKAPFIASRPDTNLGYVFYWEAGRFRAEGFGSAGNARLFLGLLRQYGREEALRLLCVLSDVNWREGGRANLADSWRDKQVWRLLDQGEEE